MHLSTLLISTPGNSQLRPQSAMAGQMQPWTVLNQVHEGDQHLYFLSQPDGRQLRSAESRS